MIKNFKFKRIFIFSLTAFLLAGCSEKTLTKDIKSSESNTSNNSVSKVSTSTSKKDTNQLPNYGKYVTSDERNLLSVDNNNVTLGVSWHRNNWGTEIERGVQKNFLTISGNKLTGSDSESGAEILANYSIKDNGETLLINFEKDWLPGIFSEKEDEDDKDSLTFKTGSSLIFTKKTEEEYNKIEINAETLPQDNEDNYVDIPTHSEERFILTENSSKYYQVSDKEEGTYKATVLSGDNVLLKIENSDNVLSENMAKQGENDNDAFISEVYATLSSGDTIKLTGGTLEFVKQ